MALSTAKKGVVVHHQACSNLTSGNAKDFTAAKWEEAESAVNFDNVLTNIESLANDDNYGYRKADPYWARVWGQTEQFKSQDGLLQLVKQTTSWFGEMLS